MKDNKLGVIIIDGAILFAVSTVLVLAADYAFSGLKRKIPKDDPVVVAVMQDDLEDVKKTLEKERLGAGTDTASVTMRTDEHGRNSLIRAAFANIRDTKKLTGVDEKRAPIVSLLLANGAAVDHQDKDGWTAMMWAAWSGMPKVVETLLAAGADVNKQDKIGNSALMLAAGRGNGAVVIALLAKGADKSMKNHAGLDAWQAAELGLKQHDRAFYVDDQKGYQQAMDALR